MLNPALESITPNQLNIINQLWLASAEIAIHKSNNSEVKTRRREQLQDLKKALNAAESRLSIQELTEQWWNEERNWLATLNDHTNVDAMLCYRYLIIFYKNLTQCPFTEISKPLFGKEKTVADTKDYEIAVQDVFEESIQVSLKCLARIQNIHLLKALDLVQKLKNENIDRNLYSARHKLMDKDIAILKGLAVGGVLGVAASMVAGPIIGAWIGELAGFSGAAATSYGLALLGGGSLASGGLGMAGGSALLGILSGSYQGFMAGKTKAEIELFGLATSFKNLPIILALGRSLLDLGCRDLAFDIREHIASKKIEMEMRRIDMEREGSKEAAHLRAIEALKDNIKLYEQASEMAAGYDWLSLYDALKWVK